MRPADFMLLSRSELGRLTDEPGNGTKPLDVRQSCDLLRV